MASPTPVWRALLFLLVVTYAASQSLPASNVQLHVCRRSNPQLDACVRRSLELLRPHLRLGVPALGLAPLEPLRIPQLQLDQGTGAVSVRSTYSDVLVNGPSQFHIRHLHLDPAADRLHMRLWFPMLRLSSRYVVRGRILVMPIVGQGRSTGNYSDIDATVTMHGQRVWRAGAQHLNITTLDVNFHIGHASIRMEGLFGGDRELGEAMNTFLNDNWRSVAAELQPQLEHHVAKLFRDAANNIYSKFPIDTLLPP